MADENTVTVTNKTLKTDLEVMSYKNITDIESVQSIEAAISTHNTKGSAHPYILESLTSKANSSDMATALANKVDVISGKGLSTNDLTNNLLTLLNQQSGTNTGDETQSTILDKLGSSGVTAGNYTNASISVDKYGRLISASSEGTLSAVNMPMLSNNSTDANNDINFTSGSCWDMSTLSKIVNTAMTKRLDATFAEGTNQGGLDTGTKAVSTWYHCFAISKADGTSDFLFSLSPTAPTMPSGFVNKRRIGSILTDSSGNIHAFKQFPNGEFRYGAIGTGNILDLSISSATIASTAINLTLSVPTGVYVKPALNVLCANITTTVQNFYINNNVISYLCKDTTNYTGSFQWSRFDTMTINTSGQITYGVSDTSVINAFVSIYTLGWKDFRGEQ